MVIFFLASCAVCYKADLTSSLSLCQPPLILSKVFLCVAWCLLVSMVCVSDHVLHTKVINKASVTRICNSLLNRRGIPVMPTVCYVSEMENVHPVAISRMMVEENVHPVAIFRMMVEENAKSRV